MLSLRTREVRIEQVNDGEGCADGPLALAGGRAAWAHMTGRGNTEADFAIDTAGVDNPKPRNPPRAAAALASAS